MPVALVQNHLGITPIKAAGTTIGLNISAIVQAGNTLIASILFDNAATASKPIVSSIGKAAGETANWVFLGAARSTSTTAGAFASGEMWAIRTTVAWPIAAYTVTLDTSTVMKATQAQEFSGLTATLRSTAGTAYSTTTTAASATTTGTTPVIGDLAIGFMFQSNAAAFATTDTDTVGGAWTSTIPVGSAGGNAATNNYGQMQYKILTAASHQTFNAAAALTAGNGSIVAILQQIPVVAPAARTIAAAAGTPPQTAVNLTWSDDTAAYPDPTYLIEQSADGSTGWTTVASAQTGQTGYNVTGLTSGTIYYFRVTGSNSGGSSTSNVAGPITTAAYPAITQASYRFYADGTESGGVALAAQDSALPLDVSTSAIPVALRVRLQSTTAIALAATDDWLLQYEMNASGTWFGVGVGGSEVFSFPSTSLTDGEATTNRLGAGTGSFVAGKVSEDGLVDDLGWSANNYTEVVYSIVVYAFAVANGDTIRFRVLRNGTTTEMTYTATPTLSIIQTAAITQASYRFYADGTEAGSVALAAQDTPYTADLVAGDVSLLLRTRLQSTSTAALAATDDWQLQWERNANGTWTNADVLLDSYAVTTGGAFTTLFTVGNADAQSFRGDGKRLTRVAFRGVKQGAPPFNVYAQLYAHDVGPFGSGKPTGSPLATSTLVNASTFPATVGTAAYIYFSFDGTFTLVNNTPYFIAVTIDASGSASNYVAFSESSNAPSAAGQKSSLSAATGLWTSSANSDMNFQVYTADVVGPFNSANLTDGEATTNRLGAGSGSFVAGKVSEDGLVDDLQLTANNYTEVVYSITLRQATLANGDTLRFRVLRNGATTEFTYTQTPTLSITKGAVTASGRPKVYVGGAFTKKPLKVWNGTAWVEKPVKVWTGTVWKTLT